jgi:uncharacterized protein YjfI (DUF2170 family)
MDERRYWDVSNLASALAATEAVASGRISLSFIPDSDADGVMQLKLHDFGDLAVVLGVAGLEIQASVALVPVSDIQNSAVFDRQLLRANKLLPLSTFGITTIGGQDYYEIFGQMSGASRIEEVLEEIETLGRNALDAAEMIETWTAKQAA